MVTFYEEVSASLAGGVIVFRFIFSVLRYSLRG